jgi:hypothetical protein
LFFGRAGHVCRGLNLGMILKGDLLGLLQRQRLLGNTLGAGTTVYRKNEKQCKKYKVP